MARRRPPPRRRSVLGALPLTLLALGGAMAGTRSVANCMASFMKKIETKLHTIKPKRMKGEANLPTFPNGKAVTLFGVGGASIPKKSFGSCALVGNGNGVVKTGFGPAIDSYDTVVRFGFPKEAQVEDAGNRTDVVVKRACNLNSDEYARFNRMYQGKVMLPSGDRAGSRTLKAYITAEKFCMEKRQEWRGFRSMNPFNTADGVPVMYWDCLNTEHSGCPTEVASDIYRRCTRPFHVHKPKKPTTGWSVAVFLYASQLCTSIDLFGFSATGTAKTKFWDFAHPAANGKMGKPYVYGKGARSMLRNPTQVTHSLDLEYLWWRAMSSVQAKKAKKRCPVRFIQRGDDVLGNKSAVNNVTIESDERMASVGNRMTEEQMATHGIPTAGEAAEPNGDVEDDDGAQAEPEVDAPPPKKRSFVSWLFGR